MVVKNNSDPKVYQKFLGNFHKEYSNMVKVNNDPNTVSVLDYVDANGTAYIVMEFIEGETLSKKIDIKKSQGRLYSLEEIVSELKPIADTLDRIHKTGMVHRDISPDNIIFPTNRESPVKLMDFGAAREWDPNHPTTIAVMKDGYAPPEQYLVAGEQAKKGSWTDVYALAATIYTAITGIVPVKSNNRIVNDIDLLQTPSSLGISIDSSKETVLMKALATDYRNRYSHVGEFFNCIVNPQLDKTHTQTSQQTQTIQQIQPIQQNNQQPVPEPSKIKKFLPWVAAIVAAIAMFISIDMNSSANRRLRFANDDLVKAQENSKKYHAVYEELCNASNGFFNYPPIVTLKTGQTANIMVCKKDGNIRNLLAWSNELSGEWGSWDNEKKVVPFKVKSGTKQGMYTVTFYDSKENTSCATLVIVE